MTTNELAPEESLPLIQIWAQHRVQWLPRVWRSQLLYPLPLQRVDPGGQFSDHARDSRPVECPAIAFLPEAGTYRGRCIGGIGDGIICLPQHIAFGRGPSI